MTHEKENEKPSSGAAAEAVKIAGQSAAILAMKGPTHAGVYLALEGLSTIFGRAIGPKIQPRLDAIGNMIRDLFRKRKGDTETDPLEADHAADTLSIVFRSLLEVPDPATLPVLAALAEDYIGRGKPADSVMRKTARMIADCDASDLDALLSVLRVAQQQVEPGKRVVVGARWKMPDRVDVRVDHLPDRAEVAPVQVDSPRADRAVSLLASSGLGHHRSIVGGEGVALDEEVVDRLAYILSFARAP